MRFAPALKLGGRRALDVAIVFVEDMLELLGSYDDICEYFGE